MEGKVRALGPPRTGGFDEQSFRSLIEAHYRNALKSDKGVPGGRVELAKIYQDDEERLQMAMDIFNELAADRMGSMKKEERRRSNQEAIRRRKRGY